MSFFKSNKTNTTATVNETTTEENTNKGGGLLTTLAVAGGTAIGIGAVIFGGRKAYKYFHRDEEIINSEDDEDIEESKEDEDFIEVPVVEAPVDDFKEVETEIPVNEAPVEAEEVKTEEPTNEEPVEAEEAEEEKPSNVKETKTMKFERLIGKVVSSIPYDAPETVDLTHHIRCMGGYLYTIDMKDLEHTGRLFISEQCLAMTNLVIGAIIHMISGDINDLEDYHHVYGNIKRLIKEFKESNIMDFTQNPELCKAIFEENTHMVMQNLVLTKDILNLKEVKPAASKTSTGENQTVEEVPSETQIGNSNVVSDDGETVTMTASVSQESIDNVNDVINIVSAIPDRDHPETNDLPYFIRVIGGRIRDIKEDDTSKSNKFMDACVDVCDMAGKAICNLANSGKNPLASMQWIDKCTNELVASGIIDNTYDPVTYRAAILKAHKDAIDVLSKLVSGETKTDANSSGETQTEEPLTYTMSEKIQEAVQQSDETAAATEHESKNQAPMSPEASSLAAKLQEVGALMRAEKWIDAAEFYKTQLTPYLADDDLSKELRDEIMSIKTKATNMLMSQKQLEAKQKAASAKASKKSSRRRRRH